MRLLFHHLKKDLRHLRAFLAVGAVLLGLHVISMSVPLPSAPEGIGPAVLTALLVLSPVWLAAFLVVAVPVLIQDDPPSGGGAFWLTRPIPAGLLAVSKGLFLLLFFVLTPLVVELAVFAAHGMDARDTLLAGTEILLRHLALVSVLAGLAALTQDFLRFATWGLVLVAACAVVLFALHLTGISLEEPGGALIASIGTSPLEASRTVLACLVAVVFGATAVAHQYLTRQLRRSVALACLGLFLYFGAAHFWPVSFFDGRASAAPAPEGDGTGAIITVDGEAFFLPEAVRNGSYDVLATLPLEPGTQYSDGSETFSVLELERGAARFTVHVRLRRTNLLFTPTLSALRDPDTFYLLVNRETRETVRAEQPATSLFDRIPDTRRLQRENARLPFPSEPPDPSRGSPDIDNPWLAEADLLIVRPAE